MAGSLRSSPAEPPTALGAAVIRVEDPPFLDGSALYAADIEPRSGTDEARQGESALHVAFVRATIASGRVVSLDASEAVKAPGVVAVFGPNDFGHACPFSTPYEVVDQATGKRTVAPAQPLLAEEIGFYGQAVAVVVAESVVSAIDAAELVIVEYDEATPILDLDQARSVAVIHETVHITEADDTALDARAPEAGVQATLRSHNPRQVPCSIEPRSVLAVPGDRLTVWAATQTPHAFRDRLVAVTGLKPDQVRVINPAVGGGFGGKVSRTAEEYLVPLIAWRLRRAVRWHETRSENFASSTHGRGELIDLVLDGDARGCIKGLRAMVTKDAGAYPLVGVTLPQSYTRMIANGCYDIGRVEFSSLGVLTNRPPTSAYRGAGRAPYIGALERVVDIYAGQVGLDPAEVRRRNLISAEQFPYRTPTGATYDEADYLGAFEAALEKARYSELRAAQGERRAGDGAIQLGIGIACYNHMTTGGGGESARVTVKGDGSVLIVTGTTTQGHGHGTTWAQIASQVLGVEQRCVDVLEGDTDQISTGVGAVGSRSAQTAGMAVHQASSGILAMAKKRAARFFEASIEDVVFDALHRSFHIVGTPAVALDLFEIANLEPASEITCGEFFDTRGVNTYPSGTHIAAVEVDLETGGWTLLRFVAVDDAGVIINPMIVEGQVHGGIASGIGQVLGEVALYDDLGSLVSSTFATYPIPTADQMLPFELEPHPVRTSVNALGVKGVGESGTIGAGPAVHNAVIDAVSHLGIAHIDLPCTPDRVWRAIQASGYGAPDQDHRVVGS